MAVTIEQYFEILRPEGLVPLTDFPGRDTLLDDVLVHGLDDPGEVCGAILAHLPLRSGGGKKLLPENLPPGSPLLLCIVGNPAEQDRDSLVAQCRSGGIHLCSAPSTLTLRKMLTVVSSCDVTECLLRLNTHLSKAVSRRLPLDDVLMLIRAWSGVEAAFRDAETNMVSVADKESVFSEHAMTYPLLELFRLYRHYRRRIVDAEGEIHGHLILGLAPGKEGERDALRFMDLAIPWLSVYQYVGRLLREPKKSLQHGILRELLGELPSDARNMGERLRRASLDEKHPVAVIVVPALQTDESVGLSTLEARLRPYFEESFLLYDNGQGVFICLLRKKTEEQALLHNLRQAVRSFSKMSGISSLSAGIGGLGRPLLRLRESYIEALRALRTARLSGEERILYWSELGVDQVIATVAENAGTVEFCGGILKPLFMHDETFGTDLAKTILTLEEKAWNITATADSLAVHYNTVKYRADKALNIIGIDRNNPKERFALSLAVFIHRFGL